MKNVLTGSIAVFALLLTGACGSNSDAGTSSSSSSPLALIAEQEQLMEGSLIDRSPNEAFAAKMHERNENLGKIEKDIQQQEIPTEIDEGMGLKLVEPYKITAIDYIGSNNVKVTMEALVEIDEEDVSQRDVMYPQPGSPGPFGTVGIDKDGEACVPIFIKFKGVDGNKGSQYDQDFTVGDRFQLVSVFEVNAANAARFARVASLRVTGVGNPSFFGANEEMSAERNAYYQKYGH